jgi:hypothetical protein
VVHVVVDLGAAVGVLEAVLVLGPIGAGVLGIDDAVAVLVGDGALVADEPVAVWPGRRPSGMSMPRITSSSGVANESNPGTNTTRASRRSRKFFWVSNKRPPPT